MSVPRYISEDVVRRLLSLSDATQWVASGFTDLASGVAVDVPRTRCATTVGSLHILQASSTALGYAGFKYYYHGPKGRCSYVHLINQSTGALEAIVESAWLGAIRTAAASAIATRAMARGDSTVVGQIGAGRQAESQLEAVCGVRPIDRAQVFATDQARLAAFCHRMSEKLRINVVPTTSAQSAVRGADVVNVVTNAAEPVLHGSWLEPGQHVNAVGSNSLARRELDLEAIKRSALVVVDTRATARVESGDLLPAVECGVLQWDRLSEIGELLARQCALARNDDDITLYESHGIATQDLYVAVPLLQLASARA